MLLISIFWLILVGLKDKDNENWRRRIIIIAIIMSIILSINNIINIEYNIEGISIYNNNYNWNHMNGILEILIYGVGIILIIINREEDPIKYISIIGIVLLLYVNDLISFYITLECQSLILYILGSRDTISGGIKYFVYGSLSSAIIIFGIAMIYLEVGTTTLEILNSENIGYKLIIMGLMIKLGIAPFHYWNVEIMDNSKIDITGWFGILTKLSLIWILKLFLILELYNIISLFIIISLILGTVLGLIQLKIKRILAYSGIIQLGYILIGFLGLIINNTIDNLESWIIYIIQYTITFTILIIILNTNKEIHIKKIKFNAFTKFIFITQLLSIAGFPPFIGFLGKFIILKSLITHSIFICFIAIITSIFSFFIYFNIIFNLPTSSNNAHINYTTDTWLISSLTFLTSSTLLSFFLL